MNHLFLSITTCLLKAGVLFLYCLQLAGCSTELKPTTVSVDDAVRHYYPVMAGKTLSLDYEITNTGEDPLVISEIQSTCGCISTAKDRVVVPEGQSTTLRFLYDSSKNIGYVAHEIMLYGNFDSTSVYRLYFDVNVVPHPDYTKDYEELYEEALAKQIVHGEKEENRKNRKNYYIDRESKDR